jgi:hypothetical protein
VAVEQGRRRNDADGVFRFIGSGLMLHVSGICCRKGSTFRRDDWMVKGITAWSCL